MKLVTIDEMRAVEREADVHGWTYSEMMEKAGVGLAELVHSFFGYEERLTVIALVGSGNNGGDALVALAALAEVGWQVYAYLVKPRPETDELVQRVEQAGGMLSGVDQDSDFQILDEWIAESIVLLDGVLGTGIQLPLKADVSRVLQHVKDAVFCPPVVAVDCPSGIDCDTGQAADECIPAEMTVCMAAVKVGLLSFPAFKLAGDLQVVDIGLPEGLPTWDAIRREVIAEDVVSAILPARLADGHKGTFGTAMICAGSLNYTGAVLLAAQAAGKIGTGLVQVAAPGPLHGALAGFIPNVTWVLLPHQMGAISADAAGVLLKSLGRATALLIGPGFGMEDCTADFVRRMLEGRLNTRERGRIGFVAAKAEAPVEATVEKELPPMVIDADGLKLLARIQDWPAKLHSMAVLTPHPGEMVILTGLEIEQIQNHRLEIASQYAQKWGHVVVLKGAFTVVAAPDGRVSLVPVATSALAHAGTGDVLSGMITGLRAQGVAAFEAAVAGAWLHAHAGLAAANKVGHDASVQASDVVESIPETLAWVWQ